nr:helix-turn-helix transcriptional regulator [Bacteroides fragilis]
MRYCILIFGFVLLFFIPAGCKQSSTTPSVSLEEWMTHYPGECIEHYTGLHDSLFKAGHYDLLTDIYSGMFRYMPSAPAGNPNTLRRQLLRIIPLYNQVLSKTGDYEDAVHMLDSIRLSGHSFLTGYCAYPLLAFEAQNSLMTDDNTRTEALADSFAALPSPDDQSVVMLCCHMVSWAYHFSSARPNVASRMQEKAVEAYRQGGETGDAGAILARLGYYYRREGRYVRAVDLSLEAVEWYDKHPGIATDGMIRACADLAALYSTLALTEKALEINAKVVWMAARKDSMALCGAYRARSSFFMDLGQADSASFYLDKEKEVARRMGKRNVRTWRRDRAKYWLQMCPDSTAAALRDMEVIFADSAGVRPSTHSSTRYWLGLALTRSGREERGLAMMEQAHREFTYMDWDEMEAFAAKGLLGIYASRHLASRILELYPRYAALQDSLNEKDKLRYTAAANVRYETGRKEQEYRTLMAEVELKERTLTYIGIVVVLLLMLLGLAVIYMLQRRRHYRRETQLHRERLSRLISIHQELNRRYESLNDELEKVAHADVIDNVRQKLNPMLLSGDDEIRFRQSFAALYPHYLPALRCQCPELTRNDELLCMLILLNQSTDEIALALGISRASVNSGRSRIRKKLGLGKDESLEAYLQNIRK